MQGSHIIYSFHTPGALSANANIRFTALRTMTLQHVSVVGSNASDATIDIGISTDTDSILDGSAFGDSNTPATYSRSNFASTNETGLVNAGEIVVITIDFDGASGTAVADSTIVLTFTE